MIFWALMACVLRNPELLGMQVVSVEVTDVQSERVGVMFGVERVDAVMKITDDEGVVHHVPVRGTGPSMGVGFAVSRSADLPWTDPWAELSAPEALRGQQLFGRYSGTSLSGAWVLGAERQDLRRRNGARWSQGGPVVGVAMWMGVEWMWLRPAPTWTT